MAAYAVSEVDILDERSANSYRQLATASIAEYNGRYLSRGAKAKVAEGEQTRRQIVIVAFPSMERIRTGCASAAYDKALERLADVCRERIPPFL
ncbi:MAG TPA: DUF1330 domain-containing protein [Betaproteobacteria bacterium]|nr:DUF1330 domain-containing protein [Betaproteobacteria bacterium]